MTAPPHRRRPADAERRPVARGVARGRRAPARGDLSFRRSHPAARAGGHWGCCAGPSGCGCSSSRWSSWASGRCPSSAGRTLLGRRLRAAGDLGAAHLQPGALRRRDGGHLAGAGAGAGLHRAHGRRARRRRAWPPSSARCASPSRSTRCRRWPSTRSSTWSRRGSSATILMMPLMTMVFNFVGLLGGYVVVDLPPERRPRAVHREFTHWTRPQGLHHRG